MQDKCLREYGFHTFSVPYRNSKNEQKKQTYIFQIHRDQRDIFVLRSFELYLVFCSLIVTPVRVSHTLCDSGDTL